MKTPCKKGQTKVSTDFTGPVSNADDDLQVGKQTPIAVRFSTVGGESGSADTARCQQNVVIVTITVEYVIHIMYISNNTITVGGSADTARCQQNVILKITENSAKHHHPDIGITENGAKKYYTVQYSVFTTRDPRGFAVKFYTEEGNWDIVGNNTPIFFIR